MLSITTLRSVLLAAWMLVGAMPLAASDELLREKIQPLLETYCYRCHGPALQTAGINFATYGDAEAVIRGRATWEKALRVLREREMPPAEPLPSEDERQSLVAWIDEAIHNVDWEKVKRPGHVTIPRLNRTEYNNTIRDLTGLDLRPADDFPADGAGETGFTNDRDGLFLPPLLMERYFAAAEQVVDDLLTIRSGAAELDKTLEIEDLLITETNIPKTDYGYDIWVAQPTIYGYVRFPRFGRYQFRVRAWSSSENDGEMAGVTLRVGGKIIGQDVVLATADEPATYTFHANVPPGNHQVSLHWFKQFTTATNSVSETLREKKRLRDAELLAKGEEPKPDGRAVRLSLDSISIRSAYTPEQDGSAVFIAEPGSAKTGEAAARKILENFAARAFRRPAEKDEIAELMALYRRATARGEGFDKAVGLALNAVLISPKFLFRVEQGDAPDRDYRLNDYELASRLSFFLWMTTPDAELLELADKGRLHRPEVVEQQVRRMLRDPKARAFTETFSAEWLGFDQLGKSVNPDTSLFPEFDTALRESMKTEAAMFFDSLIREDVSLLRLIDANYTFINESLAKHYGLEGVVGRDFRRVSLADGRRGGILGMGAVLTATSLPVRTSPVVRGKWVLETLLGEELPPPPPDAGELPEPGEETKELTLRQRFEMHRKAAQCASCHNRIDPIGYGLENFDAIGRWRDQDNGQPVDSLGVLPSGERFSGPLELKKILASRQESFARTISGKMLEFALGRKLEFYDTPVVERLAASLAEGNFLPSILIVGCVNSYPFQYQRGSRAEERSE